MKKSVRKELSEMVYVFDGDIVASQFVIDAVKKMGIAVEVYPANKSLVKAGTKIIITLSFDPEDIQTPILQHNIKVFLSRYEYALQVRKKVPWYKKIFSFLFKSN